MMMHGWQIGECADECCRAFAGPRSRFCNGQHLCTTHVPHTPCHSPASTLATAQPLPIHAQAAERAELQRLTAQLGEDRAQAEAALEQAATMRAAAQAAGDAVAAERAALDARAQQLAALQAELRRQQQTALTALDSLEGKINSTLEAQRRQVDELLVRLTGDLEDRGLELQQRQARLLAELAQHKSSLQADVVQERWVNAATWLF